MLSIRELYYGWITFWSSYFILSTLFPKDIIIIRPNVKITHNKLIKQLLLNCLVTGLSVPIVSYIPQLIFIPTIPLKYISFLLLSEVWFYYMHRLMHTKYFYRWHSDHHSFVRTYALAGLYCSVVEMLLVNQMSIALPYQLLGFTFYEILFFNIIVSFTVLKGHAHLNELQLWIPSFLITGVEHEVHHYSLIYNYGIFYILDRIHGTYKKSMQNKNSYNKYGKESW